MELKIMVNDILMTMLMTRIVIIVSGSVLITLVILFCISMVLHLRRDFGSKKKREIVQIASCEEADLVLCDDKTLWMFKRGVWSRVPDVPQDKDTKL
jgi:hypothetical protein